MAEVLQDAVQLDRIREYQEFLESSVYNHHNLTFSFVD